MKTVLWIITAALLLAVSVSGCYSYMCHYNVAKNIAPLLLADDASTPQQKSLYIGQFLDTVRADPPAKYGAWFFPTERERVDSQLTVLASLRQRCDDLAKVNPAELGYAQGMQQITGQEFDHVLAEVRSIISKAYIVHYGWLAVWGWTILSGLFGVSLVASIAVTCEY